MYMTLPKAIPIQGSLPELRLKTFRTTGIALYALSQNRIMFLWINVGLL
jgi:hypothetical protein